MIPQNTQRSPRASTSGTAVGEGGSGGFRLARVDQRLEGDTDPLGRDTGLDGGRGILGAKHADGILAPTPAVTAQVALGLVEGPQPLHGGTVGAGPDVVVTLQAMAEARARVFEYRVTMDSDWTAHSQLGGSAIPREAAWSPEHLLLAALTRCTLTSLEYHARRQTVTFTATRRRARNRHAARGGRAVRARRHHDHIRCLVRAAPEPETLGDLLAKAERDCFVGASLTVKPTYVWNVNHEEL